MDELTNLITEYLAVEQERDETLQVHQLLARKHKRLEKRLSNWGEMHDLSMNDLQARIAEARGLTPAR